MSYICQIISKKEENLQKVKHSSTKQKNKYNNKKI